jgi:hypothetical protein
LPNIAAKQARNLNQVFNIAATGNEDTARQVLSIRIGEHHFGFSISNHDTTELLQLTWYTADENGHLDPDDVYTKHPELRNSFQAIMIGYDHPRSLLVPPGSYAETDPRLLLETMYGVNGRHTILKENISGWQLQNVYAVPKDLQDWLTRHFPTARCRHNYSIGIKQINAVDLEGSILVDFRGNDFSLVVSKASRLLLVQTFSYANPADVIYYLIKICQELSFKQETVQLVLSGLVEKKSNLYRELDQYFLNIRFREPAWQIHSAGEQDYPAHFFTSLNDLALCAS